MTNALIAVGGALIISLTAGTLYYFLDTRWGPARREKMFNRSPFKELLEIGFRREIHFLVGIINGYTTIISYSWQTGKSGVKIDVLFDPLSFGHVLSLNEVNELIKRNKKSNLWKNNNYYWTRSSIEFIIEYSFSRPSLQQVITKSEEMSAILAKESLHPISYDQVQKSTSELIETIEKQSEKSLTSRL